MPNEKKEIGVVGQIAVGILVALIAGGTSPWWWDKFFGSGGPPTQPSSSNTARPPAPVIEPTIAPPTPVIEPPIVQRLSPPASQVDRPSSPPFGTAPKSWCMGMRDQWKSGVENFGTNDESIGVSMHEKGCDYWGITAP